MPGFHLGLRLCDALQHLGIVDGEECDIIASSNSDRPFYKNLQFLLAPIVGLVILICFVFEDICLSEVPRSGEGSSPVIFDNSKETGEKKPKADAGRGDTDTVDGDEVEKDRISAGKNKDELSYSAEKLEMKMSGNISRSKSKLEKDDRGGRLRWHNYLNGILALGSGSYDGPLRVTLVDEDGLSNCYHVRAELPIHELLQMHCGKQEIDSLVLRHSGRQLDPGVTVGSAGLKDLDVLDLEANYRKLYKECRSESEENTRYLRQQLDLTHRDIQVQQGRLAQFERQMKLHARCAKSNEQQARDYQTRLKRLTADITTLQKMSVAQQRTQKAIERAAENLRVRLEENGKQIVKTKDSSWLQNLLGAAKTEIQTLSQKLTKATSRVAKLEQKGSNASLVQELEEQVGEAEKKIAKRAQEVADWKEKWETSNRQAKAALKAMKANKKAKRLEEEQQKVESNRQKDKYMSELNALKQKLETQRKSSEQQWRRLQEAKTQIEKLRRKLASQEEAKKSLERDMDIKTKGLQESCADWKSKAKANARSLSESRASLQQANKRCKELQKWKKGTEEDTIPKLKKKIEELKREVEIWQKQSCVYSEKLREALEVQAQANSTPAAIHLPVSGTNKSQTSTNIPTSWGVSPSSLTSSISPPNSIGRPPRPIGSKFSSWGNRNEGRRFVPSWGGISRPLHTNGSSRWTSFNDTSQDSKKSSTTPGTITGHDIMLNSGKKSQPSTTGWPRSDESGFGEFKDGSVVGSGRERSTLVDRSRLVSLDGPAMGSTSSTGESMFGKLALANRSKPLVIVDDSSDTQKSPHTSKA